MKILRTIEGDKEIARPRRRNDNVTVRIVGGEFHVRGVSSILGPFSTAPDENRTVAQDDRERLEGGKVGARRNHWGYIIIAAPVAGAHRGLRGHRGSAIQAPALQSYLKKQYRVLVRLTMAQTMELIIAFMWQW